MTTKCIVIHRKDGGVTVRHPAWHARLVQQFVPVVDADGVEQLVPAPPVPLSSVSTKIDPADPNIPYAETEDEFLWRILDQSRRHTDRISATVIPASAKPTDYSFRDAWTHDGKSFGVDMAKAKEIWRERLRKDREPILAGLDVEWSRAMAKGDAKAAQEIEGKRQKLRDLPADPAIDAAQSPDELKAIQAQDRLSK